MTGLKMEARDPPHLSELKRITGQPELDSDNLFQIKQTTPTASPSPASLPQSKPKYEEMPHIVAEAEIWQVRGHLELYNETLSGVE